MMKRVKNEYNIELLNKVNFKKKYKAIIVTVAHKEFKSFNFSEYKQNGAVIFDTKSFINKDLVDGRL